MQIKTAREILTRAKKDEIFDGEMPDTDAEVLSQAAEIVQLAEQAWATHVRGPEVEAILKLAAADQNGGDPEDSDVGDTDDEHAPPEGISVGAFDDLPESLSKSEPWDGYGEATVKEITEGVNWFAENQPDDILDILKNVWAYESGHKDRSRILTFVKEAYVKFGGELGQEAESGEGVDQSGSGEVDEGAEGVQGEEEIDPDASGDTEQQSDAPDDAEPEAGAESGEGEAGQAEPDAENKSGGPEGGSGGGNAEAKLVGLVEKELARERVDGIPSPPKDKAPELPWNWADITDTQLHDFHMQYASLAYYKAYQRSRAERIAMHCKEAADEIRNKLLIEAPKYDEKNKEIKVTVLEAQIASNPSLRRWRKMQGKYDRYALQAKYELESLHKLVEALSRLETMRHQSWERSRK